VACAQHVLDSVRNSGSLDMRVTMVTQASEGKSRFGDAIHQAVSAAVESVAFAAHEVCGEADRCSTQLVQWT
jgi:hypothetical protein